MAGKKPTGGKKTIGEKKSTWENIGDIVRSVLRGKSPREEKAGNGFPNRHNFNGNNAKFIGPFDINRYERYKDELIEGFGNYLLEREDNFYNELKEMSEGGLKTDILSKESIFEIYLNFDKSMSPMGGKSFALIDRLYKSHPLSISNEKLRKYEMAISQLPSNRRLKKINEIGDFNDYINEIESSLDEINMDYEPNTDDKNIAMMNIKQRELLTKYFVGFLENKYQANQIR